MATLGRLRLEIEISPEDPAAIMLATPRVTVTMLVEVLTQVKAVGVPATMMAQLGTPRVKSLKVSFRVPSSWTGVRRRRL